MPHIEVIPVESRRDRKRFFNLPWDLYRGDPYWVPPIRIVQKELLNFRAHPFYDTAEIRHFLALKDGVPAGRIAAIINHAHNKWYHEQRGFFGFFESVDDAEVSGQLFDAGLEALTHGRGKGLAVDDLRAHKKRGFPTESPDSTERCG